MATILDLGILKGFTNVFIWLLIFVVVYGALEVSNLLKNRGLHLLIAFAITLIVAITGAGTDIVSAITPWAVVLVVLIFFVFAIGQFAGLDSKEILSFLGGASHKGVMWYVLIPLIIILLVAWTGGCSQNQKPAVNTSGQTVTAQTPQQQSPLQTLVNPKVLGMIVIMLIAMFTLLMMAGGGGAVK